MKAIRFTANWCAPCKQFQPTFDKIAAEFPDVEIEVVDLSNGDNAASTKARKHNVLGIPAVVLLNDTGEEVARMNGTQPEDVVRQNFEKLNESNKTTEKE